MFLVVNFVIIAKKYALLTDCNSKFILELPNGMKMKKKITAWDQVMRKWLQQILISFQDVVMEVTVGWV